MNEIAVRSNGYRTRLRLGLGLLIVGWLIFLLGIDPDIFRLDRSPVIGFIQISVFLFGEAMICLGGYLALSSLWQGKEKSIAADIGLRLISTGYLISFATGMADVFGYGSHPFPYIPYFGHTQAIGVMIGEAVIIFGFVLLVPFPRREQSGSGST